MENILQYYQFSPFKKDTSGTFSKNEISFTELNSTHFLIFEKQGEIYNLYVSKYASKKEIGINPPLVLEVLVNGYDKSVPKHRLILREYLI